MNTRRDDDKTLGNRVSGKRAATTRRRLKRRVLPTPAAAGVLALILAGGSTVLVGNAGFGSDELSADYQTISKNYSETGLTGAEEAPDISRDFDREVLEEQAEAQAGQREEALAQLVDKAQSTAEELKKDQWVIPLAGYRLTARFGQSSSLWSTVHTGDDFAAPSGTGIVSIAAGTVLSTGYDGAYGNKTVIELEDGTEVWYCHQSSSSVSVGQSVDPGQQIGTVGSTGNVTGPHLHLEIRPGGGSPVNPTQQLIDHGVTP